jgi:CHASE3 domain sensor protein
LSGLATYLATARLLESEKWVIHTYEVRAAIGDIDSAVLRAGRARSGCVISGTGDFLSQFEAAVSELPLSLQHLRELTQDNPQQQELCSRLEDAVGRRIALLRESIQLQIQSQKKTPEDDREQADLARQAVPISSNITSIMPQMREEEQRLLDTRGSRALRHQLSLVVRGTHGAGTSGTDCSR